MTRIGCTAKGRESVRVFAFGEEETMKKMNRFLAVCLLAGLLLMLAVPVFAAEEADYGTVFARASTNSIYD